MAVAGAVVLLVSASSVAYTQTPNGTITGTVTDSTRAGVAGASVSLTNLQTGQMWPLKTSAEGIYTAVALLPGEYRVTVEVPSFKRVERDVIVEAGTTSTADLVLEIGDVTSGVTVAATVPLLHREHHQIGGVVKREQIENVPLNGRNFLELAKLEPGVMSPVRGAAGNRTFIATLGSGLQAIPRVGYTRVTVDGASINAFGTIGTSLQISPDVVEEFQLSTASFDLATSLTTNGSVNVVTRSGSNEYRGSGFVFYRDHHLAAYPGLRRDASNPHPFFQRRQFGGVLGGPIKTGRAFFMSAYEHNDQTGVATVQPASDFAAIGGIFESPLAGHLLTARVDARVASQHTLMARYTRDASSSFAQPVPGVLPSGWTDQTNDADQTVVAMTGVLGSAIAYEARVSHFHLASDAVAPDANRCRDCFGWGAPRISVSGANLTFGLSPNAAALAARRYQLTDSLTWQHGRHRFRTGFEWEHSRISTTALDADRLQLTLWSPQSVRQANQLPGGERIPLPPSFATVNDLLQLPLRNYQLTIGPGAALEKDFRPYRVLDLYRLYVADTWRATSSLTVNAGLGWSYEPNALNHDLTKPALVGPLLGEGRLNAPRARAANLSPVLGFAWAPDANTVLRGGTALYFDPAGSTNSTNLANERFLLAPLGTGRLTGTGSDMRWNGVLLNLQPTTFTAAQFLSSTLPEIRAELAKGLDSSNRDSTLRNLNLTKEGNNLYDPSYAPPSALHVTLGVQRELGSQFVVSADVVWKRFRHTFINGIDYNRYNSASGPVIRRCDEDERNDSEAMCSNGPIRFDTTSGRARYAGLLLRAEKRIPGRAQFLASYALGSYIGSNGTGTGTAEMGSGRATGFRNDDWFANYGPLPTDIRHILNVSGYVGLPWRFQVAFNVSANSSPPFTAWLGDLDLDGDGTTNDLLPGTTVNAFGRGLDEADLSRLVDVYNQTTARRVTLPAAFSFFDNFFTQDVRLTRMLAFGPSVRVAAFGEVFNLFNTANLIGYNGNLLTPALFGRPDARFTQIFGSGGPRAFQLGARISF
ncbi:MAG: carboxypeptidase regulatory-like domain-containing protein [Vicinamibacterales bacterium]